ncbi:hypothetical protein BV372_30130 [Nostoc sp. T09]|uniref:hypothetical protein n=1 Tax=Nostoc sp. T09 TaxID=1932621 RepID=UPI000B71ACC2|nr:hypothetical protein [Nostoc sp. T09]OUL23189.1 hypothetical protein BV372_30130 [Nostoc sp. T09]
MVLLPACPPQPRGKSLGWKTGQPRQRITLYPTVKKTTTKPRKEQPESTEDFRFSCLKLVSFQLSFAGSFFVAWSKLQQDAIAIFSQNKS